MTTTATGRTERSTEVEGSQRLPSTGRASRAPLTTPTPTARTRRTIVAAVGECVADAIWTPSTSARPRPPTRPTAMTRAVGRTSTSMAKTRAHHPTRARATASAGCPWRSPAAAVNTQAAVPPARTASGAWTGRRRDGSACTRSSGSAGDSLRPRRGLRRVGSMLEQIGHEAVLSLVPTRSASLTPAKPAGRDLTALPARSPQLREELIWTIRGVALLVNRTPYRSPHDEATRIPGPSPPPRS